MISRLAARTRRESAPLALLLAIPLVLLMASLAAMAPDAALVAAIVAALLALLALGPLWMLLPLTLGTMVASELARAILEGGGAVGETGYLGHGRLIVLMAAVSAGRLLTSDRRPSIPVHVVVAVVAYGCWLAFATLVAAALGHANAETYAGVQRDAGFASAAVIGFVATPPGARPAAMRAIGWSAAVIAAAAVVHWAWGEDVLRLPALLTAVFEAADAGASFGEMARSAFPFPGSHPNIAATVFVMLAGLAAPRLARSPRPRDRVLLVAMLLLTGAAVLSTQSRAGLAMLGVLSGGLLLSTLTRASLTTRVASVVAILAMGVVVLVGYERLPAHRSLEDTTTLEMRRDIWVDAWDDFTAAPLLGQGYGRSGEQRYGPTSQSVHSEYLGRLVDGGIVGLAIFGVLLGTVVRLGWRASGRGGVDVPIGHGLLLLLAVLAVSMLINESLTSPIAAALLWLGLGIGASIDAEPSGGRLRRSVSSG